MSIPREKERERERERERESERERERERGRASEREMNKTIAEKRSKLYKPLCDDMICSLSNMTLPIGTLTLQNKCFVISSN